MKILAINIGSSSIRLSVFDSKESPVQCVLNKRYDLPIDDPSSWFKNFLQNHELKNSEFVVYRVVHGGYQLHSTCFITKDIKLKIQQAAKLAPLHNPLVLEWIELTERQLSSPHIAVFDTAFYSNLPSVAKIYAIPQPLTEKHALYRYGFHGLAHQSMWEQWKQLHLNLNNGGKVITLQLGSGASITAIENGKPIDTSMGFSPLEGLVMGTRCGDMDPGLIIHLLKECNMTIKELEDVLNKQSGLLGVSQESSDMNKIIQSKTPASQLALSIYCYRIIKYIGAYIAILKGVDGIIFGGGIGENSSIVRDRILSAFEWMGLCWDKEKNKNSSSQATRLSKTDSSFEAWIVPVDESQVMLQEALALIKGDDCG